MADDAVRALEAETLFRRTALEAVRGRVVKAESARECEDCGGPIPEARRRAAPGCIRCVACQNVFEKTYRRN